MRHTHVVLDFHSTGKTDSFIGVCHCGKEETFATWWNSPPRGWSKKQWKLLQMASILFLNSLFDSRDTFTEESMKKYRDLQARDLPTKATKDAKK